MSVRETLLTDISRQKVADLIERCAFLSVALSVLGVALKGLAIAFGFIGILVVGPFLTAAIGFLITAVGLIVLSIALDYETIIEAALESPEDEEESGRTVDVQQGR